MWALKCKTAKNNYVPLNYCFDLKKGFCLTACSQVYNEIILDGNHTRMDETEHWSEYTNTHTLMSSHLQKLQKTPVRADFFQLHFNEQK